jgi:hypothetical protein
VRGPISIFSGSTFIVSVDIDEHRLQASECDDVRRRRKRVGGHEHFVAGLEAEREHGEMQRGGAGADGKRVLDLARLREARFELVDLRAHREHAALEDLTHLVELGLARVGPA